jgi:DUF4097 and DUF4098 domain-containing protein YvlB
MSTPLLDRLARPGVVATLVLAGIGIPQHARAAAVETERVARTAAFTPGATLTVRNFSGHVTITGSDRTDVSVQAVRRATRERLDRIALDVRTDGRGVRIDANKQLDPGRHNENVVETDLTIEVPRQASLDVEAFSSAVEIRGITGTQHRVKTFSGDQRLENITGPLDADAFSGSITVAPGWRPGDRLSLHTFSGGIDVQVPAAAAASVEFSTFSGGFACDVPMTLRSKDKRSVRGDLGGGTGGELKLHTFSGDVHLRK